MGDYARFAQLKFGAEAVAAAFPGPVDESGRITALPTIWGEDGQSLCPLALDRMLEQRLPGMRVRVFNDVTAAGYRFIGELHNFALFTLGSGVGLKVFIDGVPQVGLHGQGGELTHRVFAGQRARRSAIAKAAAISAYWLRGAPGSASARSPKKKGGMPISMRLPNPWRAPSQ